MTTLIEPAGRRTRPSGSLVVPKRHPDAGRQPRAYLTEAEVEQLTEAARLNHHGHRDATMIEMVFRHGLRAIELIHMQWNQIDLRSGILNVRRVNHGLASTHRMLADELRALRRVRREQKTKSKFVFTSQLGKPFTQAGLARMIERAGVKAGFRFKTHPHMLRHACGYALAKKGYDARALQLYLGHRGAQYVERYIPRFAGRLAERTAAFQAAVGARS
jgi:type 1 fimbriae regulatory protein FimB/type 1 fimbriae regulatory protein FimE